MDHLTHELFEAYPAPTLIVDDDVRLVQVNRAARELFGGDPCDGAGPSPRGGEALGCVHSYAAGCGRQPSCSDCVIRSSVRRALDTGAIHRARTFLRRRVGSGEVEVCALVSASPIRYGERPHAVLTLEDVSDVQLKDDVLRAEQAARRAHELAVELARFPQENPDPVLRLAADGTVVYANDAALALADLGLAAGRPAPAPLAEAARHAIESRRRVVIEAASGGRLLELSFRPTATDVNIYGQDVTERKRADEALRVVTRLYSVLSRVNEAIVRLRDERLLFEETCRAIAEGGGFPLVWIGLVEGTRVVPAASWGDRVAYLQEIRVEVDGPLGQGPSGTCLREDHPVVNEDFDTNGRTAPWRAAARRFGLRASAAFPLHRGGKPVGVLTLYADGPGAFNEEQVKLLVALSADLSYALDALELERRRTASEAALRESERSLREAHQRKDEFIGLLSHELRNPLAPLRNLVSVLEHPAATPEQAARARAGIRRQAEHLTRLVDDLLDVTRIARGKIELRRGPVELREVVAGAAEDFRALLDERRIALQVVLPAGALWTSADAVRITQVIGNLLHNAAKFAPGGGEVVLSLRRIAADQAEISVQDDGPGIDPALLPRLFVPFVQGERNPGSGLGLGLALVKGIAELHGGAARADSPGRGARFSVVLPLSPAAVRAPVTAAEPSPARRRILVVDDNRDAADSLAEVLTLWGHAVEVAYDGPGAVEKARACAPEVVLCDIGLPGMNGYEVARTIRADARPVQIYALTGFAQSEDVARAAAAGFDGHLAKPCDTARLRRLLA